MPFFFLTRCWTRYSLNDLKITISSLSPWKKKDVPVDDTWITNEMLSAWLVQENVLAPLFAANLHQAQYVEKLEDVVRFMLNVHCLTQEHLTLIWDAQIGEGKHQSIINNVRDLLAKCARLFDTDQLDHLFLCFQRSWGGSVQQMRGLLEFIRRLAEDDKEGVVAPKVLNLLWEVAHSDDAPGEITNVSTHAHTHTHTHTTTTTTTTTTITAPAHSCQRMHKATADRFMLTACFLACHTALHRLRGART
jgi:ubiquitin carboxyl-terminal hydrolase 9/24